jgi:hypothetical protein
MLRTSIRLPATVFLPCSVYFLVADARRYEHDGVCLAVSRNSVLVRGSRHRRKAVRAVVGCIMNENAAQPTIHRPEELLAVARHLLETSDPKVMRAVVLEAITALEAFVDQTVFEALRRRLDPALVDCLQDKTKMDFDARLSILTPAALGRPVDTGGQLWSRYKRAKEIRNKVTHSGRMVSNAEASDVYKTVYDWLAFLGSTADVDLALLDFKHQVESGAIPVPDENAAEQQIADFFGKATVSTSLFQPYWDPRRRPSAILEFGDITVVIEVKFVNSMDLQSLIDAGVDQVSPYLTLDSRYRATLVLFNRTSIPDAFPALTLHGNGRISIVLVSLPPGSADN